MEFTEVLSRQEKKHLARFVTSFEQEYALNDEFTVVSLDRTLELGGYVTKHRKVEKATAKKEEKDDPADVLSLYRMVMYRTTFLGEEPEDNGIADWNVPKLALAPIRRKEVTLSSRDGRYTYSAGDKFSTSFKPAWATQFPNRGISGLNRYESTYAAALPLLPREAQAVVKDFGAGKCLVLWEADWEQREQYLDPAILVPVFRDLYSVVYTWDLTNAERDALKKASGNPI
jgi:hypothetical protein